jgi:transposase InsO family protein
MAVRWEGKPNNAKDTARAFLVCPGTILNWENAADPQKRTVGSTVRPTPPVRRGADVVRALVQTMTRLGFGGQDLAARVLARAGWRVSARSVGRYRRERTVPPPALENVPPRRPTEPVFTRFVHHTWMMDVSQIKCFLGPDLHIAAVFDAHSRVPLRLRIFDATPGTRQLAALFRRAAKGYRSPKYLITDLGGEFTGGAFKKTAKRLGTVQRFASAESIKATARLEMKRRSASPSSTARTDAFRS